MWEKIKGGIKMNKNTMIANGVTVGEIILYIAIA